jgi:hypothetical protein
MIMTAVGYTQKESIVYEYGGKGAALSSKELFALGTPKERRARRLRSYWGAPQAPLRFAAQPAGSGPQCTFAGRWK